MPIRASVTVNMLSRTLLTALILGVSLFLSADKAAAADSPVWKLDALADTAVKDGEIVEYVVEARNIGTAAADGSVSPLSLSGTLPAGFEFVSAFPPGGNAFSWDCSGSIGQTVECTNGIDVVPAPLNGAGLSYTAITIVATVTGPLGGPYPATFGVSGGGASAPAQTVVGTAIVETEPEFGVAVFDQQVQDVEGQTFTKAGGHPDNVRTSFRISTHRDPNPLIGARTPVEALKNIAVTLPPGFVGRPTVASRCEIGSLAIDFPECPSDSQVGVVWLNVGGTTAADVVPGPFALYNMVPPSGVAARFGFNVFGSLVVLDATVEQGGDYRIKVESRNTSEGLTIAGSEVIFWGDPSSETHNAERACAGKQPVWQGGPGCAVGKPSIPLFRNPTSCPPGGEALVTSVRATSWQQPDRVVSVEHKSHLLPGFPAMETDWGAEVGTSECAEVPISAELSAGPSERNAETSTGLNVSLEVPNPGLDATTGIASSDLKRVEVLLPKGMTVNPSQAEGLGACSSGEYESASLSGGGCPSDSKIGTVEVVTPLLDEAIQGDVYVAKPYDNPFGSLLAIYIVLAEPQRGVLVRLAGEVKTDQESGQIEAIFENLPQLPFSSFDFNFKQGARAPLVSPSRCGDYSTTARIWGHSDPEGPPIVRTSVFTIDRGIGGGPCPSTDGGFAPHFEAGTVNPVGGAFSPTVMRLSRKDGEKYLTRFSALLPEGLLAKLAGVEQCANAAIESAKAKSGGDESATPSCPPSSKIGTTQALVGVGSLLTRVPGSLYLAGPYNGAPLSVAAITPAVAGPFDVGTVVVREGLSLNRITGAVSLDGSASDRIPSILKGIPLRLRELKVLVDRREFTLNPTGCEPDQIGATLWGASDALISGDDVSVERASRFQVGGCERLAFKPRLALKLRGKTRRAGNPALTAVLQVPEGNANIGRVSVALPHSEFLAQSHIRTICTRVQFAAKQCPPGSVYGHASAWSPLLAQPLTGNVYLRSSNHPLPDLVVALRGPDYQPIEIDLVGRIDSKNGGIRTTFETVPDAPVSKFVLKMQGGKKSLLENSRDICKTVSRATVQMDGQNGKIHDFRPVLKARCGKAK